jgi:hypothetical protein
MAKNWEFLYLHTGDELRLKRKGGLLGRKKSKDSILQVDDDLPGHELILQKSGGQIYTLRHGSRSIPTLTAIDQENYIEEGEKISFQRGLMKAIDEVERGRLVIEPMVYLELSKFTKGALKKIIGSASKTSTALYNRGLPNLKGLCATQRSQRLAMYQKKKSSITLNVDSFVRGDENNILETLGTILSTSDVEEYLSRRTFLCIEFLLWIQMENARYEGEDLTDIRDRYLDIFRNIELRTNFRSSVILPHFEKRETLEEIFENLSDELDLAAFKNFFGMSRSSDPNWDFTPWLELLTCLKKHFPSLTNIESLDDIEGNDVGQVLQKNNQFISNIVIELTKLLYKRYTPPQVPEEMKDIGFLLRKGSLFHHGNRVVCDRVFSDPNTKGIEAALHLYDERGNCFDTLPVGSARELVHQNKRIDYTGTKWLVVSIGNTERPDIPPWMFLEGFPFLSEEEQHLPNNPWEVFITLPWFIQYDDEEADKNSQVGVLRVCSEQLVHAHFLHSRHQGLPMTYVVVPVKPRESNQFNMKGGGLNSFTTLCFRSMYNQGVNDEREQRFTPNSNPNSAPRGMRWWVERPSSLN